MIKPFPTEHHEKFDLVNVRLVSYAIKGADLDRVVQNVVQLLRMPPPQHQVNPLTDFPFGRAWRLFAMARGRCE